MITDIELKKLFGDEFHIDWCDNLKAWRIYLGYTNISLMDYCIVVDQDVNKVVEIIRRTMILNSNKALKELMVKYGIKDA